MAEWAQIRDFMSAAAQRVADLGLEFLSPDSRYFVGYLLVTLLIAAGLFLVERGGQALTLRGFLAWALPKEVYSHHSVRVDIGLILFNQVFVPGVWIAEALALGRIDDWIIDNGHAWLGGSLISGTPSTAVMLALGLLVFCAFDFAMYVHHWLGHKFPLLWEIHRVHHSAEHLTPFTADRFHPLEEIMKSLIVLPIVGLAMGIFSLVFDPSVVSHGFNMVKIWLFVRLFSMVGANLRHMHIWWSWPDAIARIVSSPAQHQIHHSIEEKHYGKNLGSFFSLWDWMFGTLYQPTEREHIRFGVNEGQNHHSTARTLWQPITGIWQVLRRPARPHNTQPAR